MIMPDGSAVRLLLYVQVRNKYRQKYPSMPFLQLYVPLRACENSNNQITDKKEIL